LSGPAFNSRLDNIQAAVLNVKMKHLAEYLEKRKDIAERYNEGLEERGEIHKPPMSKGRVWQDYIIRIPTRDLMKKRLADVGIETLIDFYPFPPYFQIPERAQEQRDFGLRLPIYPELTNSQVDFVIEQINKFHEK